MRRGAVGSERDGRVLAARVVVEVEIDLAEVGQEECWPVFSLRLNVAPGVVPAPVLHDCGEYLQVVAHEVAEGKRPSFGVVGDDGA